MDWALVVLLLTSPIFKIHAIGLHRLPVPGKPRARKVCERLLQALGEIPASLEEHPVPAFFATFNKFLERHMVDLRHYENLDSLYDLHSQLRSPKSPGIRALRLNNLFRWTARRGHDCDLAKFLVALNDLNADGARGAGPNEFNGVLQRWQAPEPEAPAQLEKRLNDLHRAWNALDPSEQQLLGGWLGLIMVNGASQTTVRTWQIRDLTERRRQRGTPPPREFKHQREHEREVGRRLIRLYGLDSADDSRPFAADLRDFLFFLLG